MMYSTTIQGMLDLMTFKRALLYLPNPCGSYYTTIIRIQPEGVWVMHQMLLTPLAEAIWQLGRLQYWVSFAQYARFDQKSFDDEVRPLAKKVKGLSDLFDDPTLAAVANKLINYVFEVPNGTIERPVLHMMVSTLWTTIECSFEGRRIYVLSADETKWFDNTLQKFGDDVQLAFPDSIGDIESAGKALAFSMYTSCVFHLMRAIEGAVRVLAEKTDATIVNSNGETLPWGVLTANIKIKIDAMPKGENQDKWLGVHMYLHACNRAFRTKTAHPGTTYTADEARELYHLSHAFMASITRLTK